MKEIYDIAIIGVGVAGMFCAYQLATKHKRKKVIGIDIGKKQGKRRLQMYGALGLLPNSDGKLFSNNLFHLSSLTNPRKTKSAHKELLKIISNVGDFQLIKDRSPNISVEKKMKKLGYQLELNNHIQMYPKEIHALSKHMADTIEQNTNVSFSFDNEVQSVRKSKGIFIISTEYQEYKAKRVIIAVGRSGWRWARNLYTSFGIVDNNDVARYGIRVEMSAESMKDFNQSNCNFVKDDVEIGPLSWFGTVIPEDHVDTAISSFRSNENRWQTDKISFNLIGNRSFPNNGFEQMDRLAKLTFILTNDRIVKEKISHILSGRSKISIMPEYNWIKDVIKELSTVIPEISTKAYYHAPTIVPMAPSIKLGNNFETEVDNLFSIGESANIPGILGAAVSGLMAGDTVCK